MKIEDLRNSVDYSIIADVLNIGDKMAVRVSPVILLSRKLDCHSHFSQLK